jgi:hypothetical protein
LATFWTGKCVQIFLIKKRQIFLMAPRAMTARGPDLRCLAGSATTGIAEFLGGRAFFPVADARLMLVRLAARAGVFGGVF